MPMNVFSRGLKNVTRNPTRSIVTVLMFAASVALILAILVARSSTQATINTIKASAGTDITITPAGLRGFQGGGDPLTEEQIKNITSNQYVVSTTSSLVDQLDTDDTSLESSQELGSFGQRQMRFENSQDSTNERGTENTLPEGAQAPGARITVTGTTDASDTNLTSGEVFATSSTSNVAIIGKNIAEKNSLSVGDTFTAYEAKVTIVGIFETENDFEDNGIIMPLATLQTLTDQSGAVTSVAAKVDSIDQVSAAVASLTDTLGDDVDITSESERAEQSTQSLQNISNLTLSGVIATSIAAVVVIGFSMIIIIRERRREIGIMKAIGGSDKSVVGQFIIEGVTLTCIGIVVGAFAGILVSGPMTTAFTTSDASSSQQSERGPGGNEQGGPGSFAQRGAQQVRQNTEQITAELSPAIIAAAIGIALFIAVLGSAIPAWTTTKIKPAEILKNS